MDSIDNIFINTNTSSLQLENLSETKASDNEDSGNLFDGIENTEAEDFLFDFSKDINTNAKTSDLAGTGTSVFDNISSALKTLGENISKTVSSAAQSAAKTKTTKTVAATSAAKTTSTKNTTKTTSAKSTKNTKQVGNKTFPIKSATKSNNKNLTVSDNYQKIINTLKNKYNTSSWPPAAKAIVNEVIKQFKTVGVEHKSNNVVYETKTSKTLYHTGTYYLSEDGKPYTDTNVEIYDNKNGKMGKQHGGYGVIRYNNGLMEIHYDLFTNGKKTSGKSVTISSNGKVMKYADVKYKTDKKTGKQTETSTIYDIKGKKIGKEITTLDKNGKKISAAEYAYKNGAVTNKTSLAFNKKGAITGATEYEYKNGKVSSKTIYTYKNGKPVKGKVYTLKNGKYKFVESFKCKN